MKFTGVLMKAGIAQRFFLLVSAQADMQSRVWLLPVIYSAAFLTPFLLLENVHFEDIYGKTSLDQIDEH